MCVGVDDVDGGGCVGVCECICDVCVCSVSLQV